MHPGWDGAGSRLPSLSGESALPSVRGLYLEEGLHNSCEFEMSLERRMYSMRHRSGAELEEQAGHCICIFRCLSRPGVFSSFGGFVFVAVAREVRDRTSSQMYVWGGNCRWVFPERRNLRLVD